MVEDTYGVHSVKLPAGSMVLYPSTSLHHVRPVTRGARGSARSSGCRAWCATIPTARCCSTWTPPCAAEPACPIILWRCSSPACTTTCSCESGRRCNPVIRIVASTGTHGAITSPKRRMRTTMFEIGSLRRRWRPSSTTAPRRKARSPAAGPRRRGAVERTRHRALPRPSIKQPTKWHSAWRRGRRSSGRSTSWRTRGVTEIVAVPLFVSSQSSVITSTEYLLGLRVDAPNDLQSSRRWITRRTVRRRRRSLRARAHPLPIRRRGSIPRCPSG